jgi:sterol desaturase/sphingolipid hydroxylase (fatty acid hydroxylase superfamily)
MRFKVFAFLFIVFFLIEYAFPRIKRIYNFPRILRNISMGAIFNAVSFVFIPISIIKVANWADSHNYGALNILNIPWILNVIGSIIILDCVIYWQHRVFHQVPWLWKLHRMHHTDKALDVSSALRFHPIEIFLSLLIKMFFVVILGVNAYGVIIFEMVLNGVSMFNHGNIRLPSSLDFIFRKFIVTPDFHRTHHCSGPTLMHSNFGFNLPFWDYLFGTYRTVSYGDHTTMDIGVSRFNQDRSVIELLRQPLRD